MKNENLNIWVTVLFSNSIPFDEVIWKTGPIYELIFNYKNDRTILFLYNSSRLRKQIMSVIRKESQGKEPPHDHCWVKTK